MFRLFLIGILIVVSSKVQAQDNMLYFYSVGKTQVSSSSVRIDVDGKNLATIIPGEYAYKESGAGTCVVEFKRTGFDDLRVVLNLLGVEPVFVKIKISEYSWKTEVLETDEVPQELMFLHEKLQTEKITEKGTPKTTSNHFSEGEIPPQRPNTAIITKSEDGVSAASDRLKSKVQSVLFDRLQFVEREELEVLWDEQKLGMSGLLDEQTIATAGKIQGVAYILFLKVKSINAEKQLFEAKLVSVEDGGVVWFLYSEGSVKEIEEYLSSLNS